MLSKDKLNLREDQTYAFVIEMVDLSNAGGVHDEMVMTGVWK